VLRSPLCQNAPNVDRCTTRSAERSRSVPLRDAHENCLRGERRQPARRRDSSTPSPAPTPIASITVQASNGWFDVAITDPSDSRPGLFYFAESDTTPASTPRASISWVPRAISTSS